MTADELLAMLDRWLPDLGVEVYDAKITLVDGSTFGYEATGVARPYTGAETTVDGDHPLEPIRLIADPTWITPIP